MSKRIRFWLAIAAAVLATYAALGFWAVPWLAQREMVRYVETQLGRKATLGALHFNPFTLGLRADALALAEADGAPILSLGRLDVALQWRTLATGAWRFSHIELADPRVHLAIAPDGRFNMAELAKALARGRKPSTDASLPRLVIDRLSVAGGRVDLQDRQAGYANTFAPIAFQLTGFSTLPDRSDTHVFTAEWARGGKLRWTGQATLDPMRASGELVLENASLPELSVYLKSATRATLAAGMLSATVPYTLAYAGGRLQAKLAGARVALRDLAVAREAATDSFAALSRLDVSGIDADIVTRRIAVADVRAEGGRLSVRRDARGTLDIAGLMREAAGPAAVPAIAPAVPVSGWSVAVRRVLFDRIALAVEDATVDPPLTLAAASARLELGLQAAQNGAALEAKVTDGALVLGDVVLAKGKQPPVKVARLGLEGAALDLGARKVNVARVFAEGGQLDVLRDRKGAINLAAWVPGAGQPANVAAPTTKATAPKAAPEWQVVVGAIELGKFAAALGDEGSGVRLNVADFHARLLGAGTDARQPVAFDTRFSLREGGQVAAQGSVVPATGAVRTRLKLDTLSLKPLQPLLAQHVKLTLEGGALSAQGELVAGPGAGARDKPVLRYDGSVGVSGVVLKEAGGAVFAAWRTLDIPQLTATAGPNRLDIPELRIAGLDAKMAIEPDRSFNAVRLLVTAPAPAAVLPVAMHGAAIGTPAADSEPFAMRIRRVRVQDAKLDFTDLSLRPQFSAKIHELNGVVNGLSSSPGARAQVELDGRVDAFGLARVRGELNLFSPRSHTDLGVVFRNVDMVPASTYGMKFAGYRVAGGKISLDLQYKIREGKLEGDNKIVIDKLRLGERVDSPDALKLPLQLAIAILEDADGRIDLGLQVAGDLADPHFSYGAVIGKALANVLTKIVTAPFRALGAALGLSGEKLEAIVFDPGSGTLLPPEREKLRQVAQIMGKREGLRLSVPAQYGSVADGAALRMLAVRREVAQRAGIQLAAGEAPGPLDTGDRAVRSALRALYAQRFGEAELDKQKKAAEASAAAKPQDAASAPQAQALPVWQRVGKMVQGEPQVADAGAFYAQLRERLEREHALPADALSQLGTERARAIAAALAEAGVGAARIVAGAPEDAEVAVGKPVPVKLGLASSR
ncbi:DUF748 domain-containing protein [Ramlibacter sp.]|uniref:DUF748 domain-containing protein n=1 Tax=Ramlibacter sp. TaxID=1917967 RepID=UPI001792C169|nr:DUF748 domain-containing protein [Ramlibacter sp.]MBA2676048.1 DUF748 domain-containing protein [Ramlibacter sp.]